MPVAKKTSGKKKVEMEVLPRPTGVKAVRLWSPAKAREAQNALDRTRIYLINYSKSGLPSWMKPEVEKTIPIIWQVSDVFRRAAKVKE